MRLQLMEWAGIVLIAVAVGFVHYAFSIGVIGLYLFASAILAQLVEGANDGEDSDH